MSTIYAIAGNISSGKTTLAIALFNYLNNAIHLDSDYIREEISGSPNGKTKMVFKVMHERIQEALNNNVENIILSSTGMSQQYINIIDEFSKITSVHKIQLFCNIDIWKIREQNRTDRWNLDENKNKKVFTMPFRAYDDSSKVNIEPNLKIDTSYITQEEVFNQLLDYIKNNSLKTD